MSEILVIFRHPDKCNSYRLIKLDRQDIDWSVKFDISLKIKILRFGNYLLIYMILLSVIFMHRPLY